MKLSTKHQNQGTTMFSNFTGGLNTSVSEEFIEENQLSECINMETDTVTGKLYTVLGTKDLIKFPKGVKIDKAAWDNINDVLLVFSDKGEIYKVNEDFTEYEYLDNVSGENEIHTASWENGLLISSGGKLQYGFPIDDDYQITTIEASPDICNHVFIRSGRVVIFDDTDNLLYSAVGREGLNDDGSPDVEYDSDNNLIGGAWYQDPNDPSTALFAQIGYKAGGKLISVTPMSSDILLFKDNGMCFRLKNEYPDWNISEVGREIYCKNPDASCSTGDGSSITLGNKTLQSIDVSQNYGDMFPSQIGQQVARQIALLPDDTKLRYIAPLNQIWFVTGGRYVLVYSCGLKTFFQRYFNSNVTDVISIDNQTYIIKDNAISVINFDNGICEDNGEPLIYQARFRTEISMHDLLVKAENISITPLVKFYGSPDVVLTVGKVTIPFPVRKPSEEGILAQRVGETQFSYEPLNPPSPFENPTLEEMIQEKSINLKMRKMFRSDRVRVLLSGKGFPFILNYITYDKVEV